MSTINSFAFVDPDDGASVEYDGPFEVTRDGGSVEIEVPADPDDYAGIHPGTAERLADREGDLGVALADASIFATGVIEAAGVLDEKLVIRLNDGNYADPSQVARSTTGTAQSEEADRDV